MSLRFPSSTGAAPVLGLAGILFALSFAPALAPTLFVVNGAGTTVGAGINTAFITGLNRPFSMAVLPASAEPEPATYAMMLGFAAIGAVVLRRRAALKAGAANAASR